MPFSGVISPCLAAGKQKRLIPSENYSTRGTSIGLKVLINFFYRYVKLIPTSGVHLQERAVLLLDYKYKPISL